MSTATALGRGVRRRRLIAVLVLAIATMAATTVAAVFSQSEAEAHGATVFPGSRQYFCYFDALTENGALEPYNEACQDAFDEVGPTPFYNWFGNLDSNGNGRTRGYIPDGELCDGGGSGPYDFSPLNDPGDWPRTHVTAGDTVEWRYNNWAHHPGRFDLYVTKEGWDPSQPIGWDDLEAFWTVNDPPQTGGAGSDENYYYSTITLPERSGYHMIFTHWVRSDSAENFYACSDVVFDGGSGEITGIRPGARLPGNDGGVIDPTDPTTDPTDPTTGPTDPGEGECTATAEVNSWGSGATVSMTVTNDGDEAISDWMVHWMWPPDSGIAITQAWNSDITMQGDMNMASPVDWNSTVGPDQSVSFGFNLNGSLSQMPELDCIV